MSDIPVPEPTEPDERLALAFIEMKDATNLRGKPEQVNGDRQACDNCHFYADPDKPVAYCWHDKLETMVGGQWWCDRWETIGEPDEQESPEDQQTAKRLHFTLVENNQWVDAPKFGEQCNTCLFYLSPDDSVSYCWHPKLQVGVGFDHWCSWWEPIPGQE